MSLAWQKSFNSSCLANGISVQTTTCVGDNGGVKRLDFRCLARGTIRSLVGGAFCKQIQFAFFGLTKSNLTCKVEREHTSSTYLELGEGGSGEFTVQNFNGYV